MKKTLRLLFILLSLAVQSQLLANTVVVKGTVKDSANHPVANRTVRIYSTDSTAGGCALSHSVVTNANGYYTDTLNCNGDIRKLFVTVESCNGNVSHDATVTSPTVELNFVVCVAQTPPATCKAAFTYSNTGAGFKFNSAGSSAPAGDSITSRSWNFGDSATASTGDPLHQYAAPGTYNVCLTIKTKSGCSSSFCTSITVLRDSTPPPPVCKAIITVVGVKDTTASFSSEGSSAAGNADSIISRTWNFGDSSTLSGNTASPYHAYKKPGAYTVTVNIKTKNGCESKASVTVTIPAPAAPACKAAFSFTVKDSSVSFNSLGSSPAGPADSITSRSWNFGDSSVQNDNAAQVSHTYKKPGTYTVTLLIRTKNGCDNRFTATVTIAAPAPPAGCKAVFTYTVKDSTVIFNSAASVGASAADSIVSRKWSYSDSTVNASLGGNVIAPEYKYAKPGSYNVTLVIKTAGGCESRFSAQVVIAPPAQPAGCKANFTYKLQSSTALFSSALSKGVTAGDSIASRTWIFGDNTVPLQGNTVSPSHTYAKSGRYVVMLYIKTQSGCESKFSDTVSIAPRICSVVADFHAEKAGYKKLQFDGGLSNTASGDSIVARNWTFGDTTSLSGNIINPVKEYAKPGIYTACLQVKTANSCEAQTCKELMVLDTITTPQSTIEYVKIVSINPNPVTTRLVATIFNRNTNTEAEISVYDIYGARKLSVKKLLTQGNNQVEINTSLLYHGEYFLKVTTKNGADSKAFYKF